MSKVRLYGATSGYVELAAPDVADDGVVALPTSANGFGKIIAVKHALFTGTQSASVGGEASIAVTDLSITHALSSASNKLIVSAYIGVSSTSAQDGRVGLSVADDGTLILIGDANGTRTRVGAGGAVTASGGSQVVTMPSVTFVYEPGDTASHTYTVHAINITGSTRTLYINRSENFPDSNGVPLGTSGFVIQEVAA